jgi:hypothetical protein
MRDERRETRDEGSCYRRCVVANPWWCTCSDCSRHSRDVDVTGGWMPSIMFGRNAGESPLSGLSATFSLPLCPTATDTHSAGKKGRNPSLAEHSHHHG